MNEPAELRLFDVAPPSAAVESPAAEPDAELRDPRQMAFSVVGNGAAVRLRSSFAGQQLTTALAVYAALTQLASDARAHFGSFIGGGAPRIIFIIANFFRNGMNERDFRRLGFGNDWLRTVATGEQACRNQEHGEESSASKTGRRRRKDLVGRAFLANCHRFLPDAQTISFK